jgi:hypothetical protein
VSDKKQAKQAPQSINEQLITMLADAFMASSYFAVLREQVGGLDAQFNLRISLDQSIPSGRSIWQFDCSMIEGSSYTTRMQFSDSQAHPCEDSSLAGKAIN